MPENVLICGTNWLGDSIISMPAIQLFKTKYPSCRITILAKSRLSALWTMHPCMDAAIELRDGLVGTGNASRMAGECDFEEVFIFPNSFRSALIPFLGGVPARTGVAGHQRRWMLTDVVQLSAQAAKGHQALEYLEIMGFHGISDEALEPRLTVPSNEIEKARGMLEQAKHEKWIGLMPGAAYGPAKRWPAEYFVEVGRTLSDSMGCGVVVMGTQGESDLCEKVRSGVGQRAVNLAGRTSLPALAAFIHLCSVVVTNDSGGMHLASAVGAPVVAVFGITDPAKTGPLGKKKRVIFEEGVCRSRDIDRASVEAEASLRAIKPERICGAVLDLLAAGT